MKEKELKRLLEIQDKTIGNYFSPDFIEFIKGEVKKRSWYERFCSFSSVLIPIKISEERSEALKQKLNFCNINLEPSNVYAGFILSLALTVILGFLFTMGFLFLATSIGEVMPYLFGVVLLGFSVSYYILIYPDLSTKKVRIEASSEIVQSVMYMAIGLKHIPNLENAVAFASMNLHGVLGKDLRKLLWDIHTGKYFSIEVGLKDFARKWKYENREFSQALDLLVVSTVDPINREETIDTAIKTILESNMERMGAYARELKNPITVIHSLGILLPVITLILFPVITIFMPNVIKPMFLILLYDLFLPLTVYWLMKSTLQKRPYSFSVTNIAQHPGANSPGEFLFKIGRGKIDLPILPFAFIVFSIVAFPGVYMLTSISASSLTLKIFAGLAIVWGAIMAVVFYTFFSSKNNKKIKSEIEDVEDEFGQAMFILGTVMKSGQSLEACLEKVSEKTGGLKISEMFKRILYVVSKTGFTLKDAVFNKQFGVIKYYPSQMIRGSMQIIIESMNKGLSVTASTAIAISRYLDTVHKVNEHLKDLVEDTVSSMQLMSTILVPLASGVIVGLSSLIIMILVFVAQLFSQLPIADQGDTDFPVFGGVRIEDIMGIETFLIVVGIYMIEVLTMLSIFIVQLERGNDWIEMQYQIAVNLFRGGVIFTLTTLLIYFLFGSLIPLGGFL